jgi:hypothetical protein
LYLDVIVISDVNVVPRVFPAAIANSEFVLLARSDDEGSLYGALWATAMAYASFSIEFIILSLTNPLSALNSHRNKKY